MPSKATAPAVTMLVANHNGAGFLEDSLATILGQTLRDIEVIVVDDASTDHSRELVAAAASRDPRVRLIANPVQEGPGAARNIGLRQAAGRWIAVADSDDLLHPDRLARLLQQAEAWGSDIAADNLLVFDDGDAAPPYAFLPEQAARAMDLDAYVREDAFGDALRKIGYLKPMFRTAFLRAAGGLYPEDLPIAEDFSFMRSLLADGAVFHVFPGLTYFYRKHAASTSHRLTPGNIRAMIADDDRFLARHGAAHPGLLRAFTARRQTLQRALDFDALVHAVKQRRWTQAAGMALRHPRAGLMLRPAIAARLGRAAPAAKPPDGKPPAAKPPDAKHLGRPPVCIITRRPVTADAEQVLGPLIRLATAFAAAGLDPHLLVPGATRAPQRVALARVPGMRTFKTVDIRSGRNDPPLPGDDWSTGETLFIARYARPLAEIVVADWLPGLAAAPFTLRPNSLLLVLVDGLPPEALHPGFASEWTRLSRADAILAVRSEDPAVLQRGCPGTPVILLPGGRLFARPPVPLAPRLAALLTRVWPGQPAPQRGG